jgi:catalase-peroxidase
MGPEVPDEELIWMDPVPEGNKSFDISIAKEKILSSGLSIQELVETAWASAFTYRGSDMRGGANGARIRLAPQKDWEANKPEQLSKVLNVYDSISKEVDASIADLIVLGGNVGIEKASGMDVSFTPGRGDASQEQTDPDSFEYLEPLSDAFRNYHRSGLSVSAEEMMLDKAQLLGLTAPEMTVLLGGMRSLGITSSNYGLLSDNPEELSNDYFKTLLDMRVQWKPNGTGNSYEALDRVTGEKKRTASRADLVFGSNSQLRALVEVYATDDNKEKFTKDFISAWNKVMNLDRFDIS